MLMTLAPPVAHRPALLIEAGLDLEAARSRRAAARDSRASAALITSAWLTSTMPCSGCAAHSSLDDADHARLRLQHVSPPGGRVTLRAAVPARPVRIGAQIVEGAAGPSRRNRSRSSASHDLNIDFKPMPSAIGSRRLAGALAAGSHEPPRGSRARAARASACACARPSAPERHARHAPAQDAIRAGHGRRGGPGRTVVVTGRPPQCAVSPSPSMKRSVRSRASSSVNCCGGDFMK